LAEPSVGALRIPFTTFLDPVQFNWPQELTDDTHDTDHSYGTVQFTTSVEVTGELSPKATELTACRLICLYAISRLGEVSLQKASQALVDIYVWQQAQLSIQPSQSKTRYLGSPPKTTRRVIAPFKIEEA
jgi:hypothetical protein